MSEMLSQFGRDSTMQTLRNLNISMPKWDTCWIMVSLSRRPQGGHHLVWWSRNLTTSPGFAQTFERWMQWWSPSLSHFGVWKILLTRLAMRHMLVRFTEGLLAVPIDGAGAWNFGVYNAKWLAFLQGNAVSGCVMHRQHSRVSWQEFWGDLGRCTVYLENVAVCSDAYPGSVQLPGWKHSCASSVWLDTIEASAGISLKL